MSAELITAFNNLKKCISPEDVFGKDENITENEVVHHYRTICKIVHEDLYPEERFKKIAHSASVLLNRFKEEALEKIKNRTYGKANVVSFEITQGKNRYKVNEILCFGEISDIFLGENNKGEKRLFKLVRDEGNNDLLENEASNLKFVRSNIHEKVRQHIPCLENSFCILEKGSQKKVNVFAKEEKKLFTFDEVRKVYPNGIDPRDAAWMFNRLIAALFEIHNLGFVHAAVTPDHILIEPETHNLLLVDWCYSVKEGEPLKAINPNLIKYYPQETSIKKIGSKKMDIYMAAKCIAEIMGSQISPIDTYAVNFNKSIPKEIINLLKACLLGYTHRVDSMAFVGKEFNEMLVKLYGPKKFRTFKI